LSSGAEIIHYHTCGVKIETKIFGITMEKRIPRITSKPFDEGWARHLVAFNNFLN
jgi:hypothetical protein